MRKRLLLLLLTGCLTGCAGRRDSYLDDLSEQGYGYGNEENAAAAKAKIRSRK